MPHTFAPSKKYVYWFYIVMLVGNEYTSVSFTSRCPQVRDGEWVCHIINDELPHFSTSKFKPLFQKKLRKFCGSWLIPKEPLSIHEILRDVSAITNSHENKEEVGFFKSLIKRVAKCFLPDNTEKDYQILKKIGAKIEELGYKRIECRSDEKELNIFSVLKLLGEYHLGNCYENAIVAELILKLNGIKNARTLFIKNGDICEHSVCVFNRDGSDFKKIINNNTIIVDPWAQKCDFANNMLVYLKNNFGNNLDICSKNGLNYEVHEFAVLHTLDCEQLKKSYPSFIFKSDNREFMKKY